MSNNVFVNTREVSCKAASGKSIAAFPDVCFTPPQTPATPPGVPIPYPNTGMASDCTDGSSTVKVSGQEVMLKNKSYFKRSSGDEAGCAPKKGVLTSKNMGKVYFTMWSMDVKFEGENVVRHLDMTTHNHGSTPPNTGPWAYLDEMAMLTASEECQDEAKKTSECVKKHVKKNTHKDKRRGNAKPGATKVSAETVDDNVDWDAIVKADSGKNEFYNKSGTTKDMCEDDECKGQFKCSLVPFDFGCCQGKTPHHVVPAHCFMPPGERKSGGEARYPGAEKYDDTKAPCICVEGEDKADADASGKLKEHGRIHDIVDPLEDSHMDPAVKGPRGGIKEGPKAGAWSFEKANDAGSDGVSQVTGCDKECLKKQSAAAHQKMGVDVSGAQSDKLMLRADSSGTRPIGPRVPSSTTPTGAGM
jgi:hypothetical protein